MYFRIISTCINVNLIHQLYFQLLRYSLASLLSQTDTNGHLDIRQLISSYFYEFISVRTHQLVLAPSIAQLVERRTVEALIDILRSLVRIRLEGNFFLAFFVTFVMFVWLTGFYCHLFQCILVKFFISLVFYRRISFFTFFKHFHFLF